MHALVPRQQTFSFHTRYIAEMKLGPLITVLFSATAFCQGVSREVTSEHHIKEVLAELQKNIKLDEENLPRYQKSVKEPACGGLNGLWWFDCWNLEFVENMQLVRHNGSLGTMSMSVERQVLRRARNTQKKEPVSLSVTTNEIDMKSATTGWNIGADINAGSWNPINGFNKGISVSGGYSSSTTTSKSISVSFTSSLTCPPRHTCRTEAWTVYLTVTGYCTSRPQLKICGKTLDACKGPLHKSGQCSQVEAWRDRVCKPEAVQKCTVKTPVTEGKLPYFEEVFFERELTKEPTKTKGDVVDEKGGDVDDKRGDAGDKGQQDGKESSRWVDGWQFENVDGDVKADEEDGGGNEVVKAIGINREGWCGLTDGWLYDPENDTYRNPRGEAKWVKMPGRKKPAEWEKWCDPETKDEWKATWEKLDREEEEKRKKSGLLRRLGFH
ncbi:hypothetical protein L249_4659 [Ophiocordyceps polyrhachis-furcata BCC 54312]|uniref:Uncharacterized protein n=1 Tax=Ophiocordyceps polyrhachis-furcata BCC 54312 TaxID=1330021 RepID=A0A367L2Z6_9HYPO|nr:hypothetical protein L249_4659 [Ophiocordyceps polyrhachis-furcata BCC 54312]